MAVSRTLSQGRYLLSRGLAAQRATGPSLYFSSTSKFNRQFSSSTRALEEAIQTPASGSESPLTSTQPLPAAIPARSITIAKLPWNAVPAEIEELVRNAGFDVKRMMFRIDRFSFENDTFAYLELGNEEQAQKAIKALEGQQLSNRTLNVGPMSEPFHWRAGFHKEHRMFYYDKNTPSQALQGLIDGRRFALSVENPGWLAKKSEGVTVAAQRRDIVRKHLSPFGLETMGATNPAWRMDRKKDFTFLAFVEFDSKESAERAVEALNDQVIEGRRVQLRPATLSPKRAEQIGKVDKSLLARLQQHGLVPKEESPKETEV